MIIPNKKSQRNSPSRWGSLGNAKEIKEVWKKQVESLMKENVRGREEVTNIKVKLIAGCSYPEYEGERNEINKTRKKLKALSPLALMAQKKW